MTVLLRYYLFYGSDGVGKFTAALNFGMAVNCLATSELKPVENVMPVINSCN